MTSNIRRHRWMRKFLNLKVVVLNCYSVYCVMLTGLIVYLWLQCELCVSKVSDSLRLVYCTYLDHEMLHDVDYAFY